MGICVSCRRRERKAPDKRAPGAKGAAAELLSRRPPSQVMANSISNIKMTNPIKGIVSKRKKRYIKDGFNLDLTYITDRLIAMGFPAEKLEGVYRNHIDEVYRFLEQKHKDHYKIYNLCSERTYDYHKFHQRVAVYPFQDHTPPTIELIQPFCEDVHKWLQAHHENVAAVHCKAGKGRTGTMVCCYLLYSGQKATADEALNYYGTERTHDEKGVTIPSQRRYVSYYAMLVRGGLSYGACSIHIRSITLSPTPPALASHLSAIEIDVRQLEKQPATTVHRTDHYIKVSLSQCSPLSGDVHVQVFAKHKVTRREKLFHFWFNTFFVAHGVGAVRIPPLADSPEVETFKLCLNKWELDDAHKDRQNKLYTHDFKIEVIVQKPPSTSGWCGRMLTTRESPDSSPESPSSPSSSPASPVSSCDDTDTENDEHWDSGVKANPSGYMWDSQEKTPLCPNANAKCVKTNYQNKLWSIPTAFADNKNNLQYPTHCEYEAYSIDYTKNLVDTASVSSDVTSTTDASQPCTEKEGKIPKVSSDHMISSIDPDRHVYDTRTCKSPTETNKKKYLFFQSGKKDSLEERKDDLASSKPRRSLGDMRASWREFSEKHFGSEHSKDKKKKNGQALHKDD